MPSNFNLNFIYEKKINLEYYIAYLEFSVYIIQIIRLSSGAILNDTVLKDRLIHQS